MKSFLTRIAIFVTFNLCVLAGLLVRAHYYSDSYNLAVIDKERRLASLPAPRIIFVGGSNLAFGLDSPMIEEKLGRKVVNMGVYANLGTYYMLKPLEAEIQPGDTVVLSLEYELFNNAVMRWGRMDGWASLLLANPRDLRNTAPIHYWHAVSRCKNGISVINWYLRETVWNWRGPGPYTRGSFNLQGDNVAVRTYDPSRKITFPLRPRFQERDFRQSVALVREATRKLKAKGADVCLVMPVYPAEIYPLRERIFQDFERRISDELDIPMILNGKDSCLPKEAFYDTYYHLTTEGTRERTRLLIERLGPYLARDRTVRQPPLSP